VRESPVMWLVSLMALALVLLASITFIRRTASANGRAVDGRGPRVESKAVNTRPLTRAEQGTPYLTFSQPVSLISNSQSATQSAAPQPSGPLAPLGLAQADVDDDGLPDLIQAAASPVGGVLRIFRADYDEQSDLPSFSELGSVTLSLSPELMVAGDFNGDAHQDLVVASRDENKLLFLAGDGHGQFAAQSVVMPGPVRALMVGDLPRRDGHDDLIVGIGGRKLLIYDRWD